MKKIYIKTSARVGYAPPVLKRTQVQGLTESWGNKIGRLAAAFNHLYDLLVLQQPPRESRVKTTMYHAS